MTGQTVLTPADGVLACDLAGGAALLDTEAGIYYALNSVGASIWSLIEQSATFDGILDHLKATFDVSDAVARRDLEALIASLAEHGLVRIEQ